MRFRVLFAALACMVCCWAQAASIETAVVRGDPQIDISSGAVRGCGMRVVAFPTEPGNRAWIPALDVSFNVWDEAFGLLKGGAMKVAMRRGVPQPNAPTVPIESFWVMSEGSKPSGPLNGKVINSESKNYLMYGVGFLDALNLMQAAWEGKELTIGARFKGEPADRILAGVAQLTDAERIRGPQCIAQLLEKMKADIAAEGASAPK